MTELRSLVGERSAFPLLVELNKSLPPRTEPIDTTPIATIPKTEELRIVKYKESTQTEAETERRKKFKYSMEYDNPINTGALEENVLKGVIEYNNRAKDDDKLLFELSVSHEPTGEFTLKIKNKQFTDRGKPLEVEIDFGGPGVKHIRTNRLAIASAMLEDLKKETQSFKDVTGALRTMVGDKAQAAFFEGMNVEDTDVFQIEKIKQGAEDFKKQEIIKRQEGDIVPKKGMELVLYNIKQLMKIGEPKGNAIELYQSTATAEIIPFVEKETGEITVPPKNASPITRFKAVVAAAKGSLATSIKYRDKFGHEKGKTQKSQELVFKEAAFFGAMISHNSQEINDPERVKNMGNAERRSKKVLNFFDNMLRGTMTAGMHEGKEARHAIKLMAAAGVEGGMTNEFFKTVDRMARKAIDDERTGFIKKSWGGVRDFFSEVRGAEKDLHRKRVEITAIMREQFDLNPFNTENPMYELVQRDVAGREEFARRLGEMPTELLHAHDQVGGERRDTVEIKQGSAVDLKLKSAVLMPAIQDILKQYDRDGVQPARLTADLRNNLDLWLRDYFMTPEFQAWKNSLPPEQSAKMDNSLSYATDILVQFEENMIPNIITNYDYYKTAESLDLQIELTIGTGKYGPNGEIPSSQLFSGEQIELNEDVWKSLSKRAESATDTSPLFGQSNLVNGTRRAFLNAAADVLVKNEVTAAVLGTAVTRGVMGIMHIAAAPIAAPIGIVFGSGIMAGFKEYAKLRSERAVVDYEEALGYHRKDNAKRYMEMKLLDYNRVDMSHRAQQFSELVQKQEFSPTDVLHLMGLVADSQARVELSDIHNINLLSASKETPTGQSRGLYQKEERLHGLALTAAKVKFNQLMSDPARFKEVTDMMGLPNPAGEFVPSDVLDAFTSSRYTNLESGVRLPDEMLAAFNTAEYQLTPDPQSLKANNDKFETERRWKSLKHGAKTGAIAGAFSGAISGLVTLGHSQFELHSSGAATLGEKFEVKVLDHTLPLKPITISDNNVAHIPMGTTLMPDDAHQPGVFDLVVNATGEHKLDNITFTHGVPNMTKDLVDQAAQNHIVIDHTLTPEYTTTVEAAALHENVTIHYDKMEGAPNGDPDSWFAHNLNQSYAETPAHAIGNLPDVNVQRVTEINAIRYLFHGWEKSEALAGNNHFGIDQIEGVFRKIHQNSIGTSIGVYQAPNAFIKDVPWILGTEQGHRAVADLLHESMQMEAVGIDLDPLHQAVYDMGYVGTVDTIPTPEEVALIFNHINKAATTTVTETATHDSWFTMTEDLTKEVFILKPHLNLKVGGFWQGKYEAVGIGLGYTQGLESPAEERLKMDERQASIVPPPNYVGPAIITPPPTQVNPPNVPPVIPGQTVESRIKSGEPRGPLDISDIRQDIAAEVTDELSKNAKALAEGGTQSRLAIRNMMSSIADKHHLPIAYLVKDGRVKLLTRPPEELDKISKDRGKIYFFNTTTGKEESEEIVVDKRGQSESVIFMSGLTNFPEGAHDRSSGFFVDYDSAHGYFESIGYNLSGFELPASEYVEDKDGAYADDIAIATAFAIAAIENKQAQENENIQENFEHTLQTNDEKIGEEFVKVVDPNIDLNNPSEAAQEKFAEEMNKIDANTFEGERAIHSIIDKIADAHKLPLVYMISGGRVRLLTKAPEIIDVNQTKVSYYDAQMGTELEMIIDTSSPEAREKNRMHFSGEANFGDVDEFKIMTSDYITATKIMEKSGYNYQTHRSHESISLEYKLPSWIQDLITSLGFALTIRDAHDEVKSAQKFKAN